MSESMFKNWGDFGDYLRNDPFTPVDIPPANRKADTGKPAMEELPLAALMIVARVMGHGRDKYAPLNWAEPSTATVPRYCAAAMRHIARLQGGEILDPESGLPHLAHAVASLLIGLHHQAGLKATWE